MSKTNETDSATPPMIMPEHFVPPHTVTLTRQDVIDILIHNMGWDDEDVVAFWGLARRENRKPGYLSRRRQEDLAAVMDTIEVIDSIDSGALYQHLVKSFDGSGQ